MTAWLVRCVVLLTFGLSVALPLSGYTNATGKADSAGWQGR